MRRAIVLLGLVALGCPSTPGAGIVLGSCIGRIGLWDSSTEVLRQWGKPIRKASRPPDVIWHYRTGTVLLTRWGYEPTPNKVIVLVITTRNPAERTPAGLGVGTSATALARALPGNGCKVKQGSCRVGSAYFGRSTTFRLANSRVAEVTVALDSGYDDGRLQAADPRCRR